MDERLDRADLLRGLNAEQIGRLAAFARTRALRAGEYLFLLGDPADHLYIVVEGTIELCFPVQFGGINRALAVETVGPGATAGWSAVVSPYRFTLSARAASATEVIALDRPHLLELFALDPGMGYVLQTRISELVGVRMLNLQALWLRELQRMLGREMELRSR